MKKVSHLLMVITAFAFILSIYGCGKDSPVEPDNNTTIGDSKSFTSTTEGIFSYDGFSLIIKKETVPRQPNGDAGTVIFSMSTSSSQPSGVPALPSGYTALGKFLNAGPEGFQFDYPIRITFSAASAANPSNLRVLGYFPETDDWRIVPSYVLDGANKILAVDVLYLGWFVLATEN
jgi:hypothetical protein